MADLGAIQQLLIRYCWAHDSQDVALLGSCFAADVQLLGARGRDEVVSRYAAGYAALTARRRHVLTNFLLLEESDTEALVQSYITLYLIRGEELELHLTGVYRDRVVLEEGKWRILAREATMDVPYRPGDVPSAPAATYPAAPRS
jgi:hypothetical protein